MGHFVTGVTVVTRVRRRAAVRDHGQRAELRLARPAAGDGRPRPSPLPDADRPGRRPVRRQHPVGGPAGAVRLLRGRAGRARSRASSAGPPGTRARPACRSLDGAIATPRMHGRRDVLGGRPRPVHRPGGRARQRGRSTRCRCSTTGAATCASSAPRRPRSRASRSGSIGGPMPTIRANGLDIGYDSVGAGPPLVMLHGATTSGRDDFAAADRRLVARRSGRTCPTRAATAGRAGTPPTGSAPSGWSTTSRRSSTRSAWRPSTCVGFSMGAMTALGFAVRAPSASGRWSSPGSRPSASRGRASTRRLMDPARIERDDPAWAADLAATLDPGQGAGAWQRLLPAIAADVAGPAAADRRRAARDHGPDAGRLRRPRSARAGRPGLASWPARSATGGCSSCPTAATTS